MGSYAVLLKYTCLLRYLFKQGDRAGSGPMIAKFMVGLGFL
jgi:hypothetical protein